MADALLPQRIILRDSDALGTPLPGGTAFFVQHGTMTPAAVYSDEEATVPRANPVVALADGSLPPVYASAAYAIDCIVTSTDGRFIERLNIVPRFGATGSAAEAIALTPVDGIPANNVQTAIAALAEMTVGIRPISSGGTSGSTQAEAQVALGIPALIAAAVTPIQAPLARTVIGGPVGSVSFTFNPALYSSLVFILAGIRGSIDNSAIRMTLSTDSGSTQLAVYSEASVRTSSAGAVTGFGASPSTTLGISGNIGLGNLAGEGASGRVDLIGPTGSDRARAVWQMSILGTTGVFFSVAGAGHVNTVTTVNAVRFALSSGLFSAGNISMYGMRIA